MLDSNQLYQNRSFNTIKKKCVRKTILYHFVLISNNTKMKVLKELKVSYSLQIRII